MTVKPTTIGANFGGLRQQALLPAERMLLAMILMLGLATVLLVAALGRQVDWLGFLPGIGAAFGMVATAMRAA